jgi:hypothetical protein
MYQASSIMPLTVFHVTQLGTLKKLFLSDDIAVIKNDTISPDSIKLISSFILLSLAVALRTLSHVTDLTASESREDTADMMILFSMPVTSDSESEVCMPGP